MRLRSLAEIRSGSKTVLTPSKWDVCFTPETRHRSATLPIAMSSPATAVSHCERQRPKHVKQEVEKSGVLRVYKKPAVVKNISGPRCT